MRNVVKGFQISHLAVPKMHAVGINNHFADFHGPRAPNMRMLKSASGHAGTFSKAPLQPVRRPGKNVAVKGGNKV